ncbi:plasmid mobilization relaxosome protein MobC [Streptococcus pluranimalium]|uniref:plasmid mobilization relaxosome protein MobC n=1 Tax=Streptococcus pluranimalium TaxID=82348 RepID=UPI003BF79EC6
MARTSEKRTRNIEMKIRFTPKEYEQVRHAMEQMNAPTFQYYAKNQLVQGQLVQIDFSELKGLRVAINRIGVNVNQIAKQANENQTVSDDELSKVLECLTEIRDMVATKLSHEEKRSLQKRKEKVIRTYD